MELSRSTRKMSIKQHITTFTIVMVTSFIGSLFWIKVLTSFEKEDNTLLGISNTSTYTSKKPMVSSETFTVLIYTGQSFLKPFIQHFRKKKCPSVPNCIISENVSDMQKSHAVIFNDVNLPGKLPQRAKNQLWIFHGMETVHFIRKPSKHWDDQFNFTMSFRKHSDIVRPYGKIVRREKEIKRNYTEVFRKKKHGGVWMSGHCPVPSKRKALAQEIGKHMHVDLFGRCGARPCGTASTMLSDCLKTVSRDYKFYFSFENTICPDYTTEKLFNIYLYDLEIIPVVNGPANAAEYLPKGTFINALDFSSASELAKKLKEIGASEEKYTHYLKEKDKYYDAGNAEVFSDAMCQLCNKLAGTSMNPNGNNSKGNSENYWTRLMKNNC